MRMPPIASMPLPDAARDRADPRDASWRAGCLGSVREALDDAQATLAFLRIGLRARAIDPGETLWIIDLAPGDGERAWRVLRALRAQAPRAPAIRYLAGCLDRAHCDRLAAHACLAPWIAEGGLYLDADGAGLPPHPLRNPPVVLAHGGFRSREPSLHLFRGGDLMTLERDAQGHQAWRPGDRRDGLMRFAAGCRPVPDDAPFVLPSGLMRMLSVLLRWSDGRLLLRGSDAEGDGPPPDVPPAVFQDFPRDFPPDSPLATLRLDAMSRWHHAHGASVHQSRRDDGGRVLHLALHAAGSPTLRDCLPELLALPHPDDHVQVLQALRAVTRPTPAQCRALLRATADDPRALAILAPHWPEARRALPADAWWAMPASDMPPATPLAVPPAAPQGIPCPHEPAGDDDE